jgi:hypothetical protein
MASKTWFNAVNGVSEPFTTLQDGTDAQVVVSKDVDQYPAMLIALETAILVELRICSQLLQAIASDGSDINQLRNDNAIPDVTNL